jgi:hypothetical protein
MGFFKKLFKGIKNVASDIGKATAYLVAAPINSITGHDFNPDFSTGFGQVVGGGAMLGVDSIHVAGKYFGDTITGGLASKAANLLRDDENKESYGNYGEKDLKFQGVKGLEKLEEYSKKGAAIIGTVYAGKAAASGIGKIAKNVGGFTNNLIDQQNQLPMLLPPVQEEKKSAETPIIIAVILFLIFKI